MKPRRIFFISAVLFLAVILSIKNVQSLDDSDCFEYEFIFARGSSQELNDVDFKNFKEEIDNTFSKATIKYSIYELGTIENGYPAYSPDNLFKILGTYISAGESFEFSKSVEKGTEELLSHVKEGIVRCKNQKYILAGYSQGAFVINKALPYLNSEKIYYVASFGDPKLYLPEGKRVCSSSAGLSSYRIYVPDCEVEEGVLSGINPYESDDFKGKRGAWCNESDFICGSSLNLTDIWKGHTTYIEENGYKKFAKIIYEKITNTHTEISETDARYSDEKKRDVVLIYDYRERMGAWDSTAGDSIREELKNRLVELANHGTRVAVYNVYTLGNVAKQLEEMIPFTNDNLGEKIDNFNYDNSLWHDYISGGGNNMYYVIKYLSKNAEWSDGAERNLYVLANAVNSDMVSFDKTTYYDAISAAKDNNVKVSILSDNGLEKDGHYREITNETNGEIIGKEYSKIKLNKNTVKNASKYFSKTFDLNTNSHLTLVIINNAIYGFSDKNKIIIKDLNENIDNKIVFIEYDSEGRKINRRDFYYPTSSLSVPDTGKV